MDIDPAFIENILARGAGETIENPSPRCKGCGRIYDLLKRTMDVKETMPSESNIAAKYCSDACYEPYRDLR